MWPWLKKWYLKTPQFAKKEEFHLPQSCAFAVTFSQNPDISDSAIYSTPSTFRDPKEAQRSHQGPVLFCLLFSLFALVLEQTLDSHRFTRLFPGKLVPSSLEKLFRLCGSLRSADRLSLRFSILPSDKKRLWAKKKYPQNPIG